MHDFENITCEHGPFGFVWWAIVLWWFWLKTISRIGFDRARQSPDRQDVDTRPFKELEDVLARVVTHPEEARMIVENAGMDPGRCPRFDEPSVFWHFVVKMIRDGATTGGVQALAAAAAKRYPSNGTFKRYARYRPPP